MIQHGGKPSEPVCRRQIVRIWQTVWIPYCRIGLITGQEGRYQK
ncbi:hypothetical protein NEICINOT_03580 [Neisseria cinerea ATCC 14685]|uniref:Uncharacterized protein n=1 Tax=Neisseria cinerea ATCC 14685 TaxID=546262 RepID=D0W1Q5_NEICI|nr:hypothetical protein NEICINOT_03580 [Neisseria cinerea ATCC 14685]